MPAKLLDSKTTIPPLRPNLVPRPRLVQSLNEGLHARHKLTLVSAPAGFGKTTLLVAWLKQIDIPAAWLSLDEADNRLPRFLAYLAAAFQQVDEEIGAPLRSALQSPQLPVIEKPLTGLLNEIALRTDPLILVLDDYHLITDAAILEAIAFLLAHQSPQLHLVLATREDPDLPLARLRARDQLNEIRAGDLRFTQGEADVFLRNVMGLSLSEQQVTALEGRTEGWAVGLQLAGLSMQKQADLKSFIADFSGSHRHILDYLTDEVLQRQSEDIRSFLLQTAILDRLSGPLCDAVTGRTDSNNVLAHLEAANLFVLPLDDKRHWYRYHHLFSELLRNELARSRSQSIPGLHQRASRWYEENGYIQAAVDHALQDTDFSRSAQLIEKYTLRKLFQGEVARVLGWFDRLPQGSLESAPMLCVYKAWASVLMQHGGRMGEVERCLQTAEDILRRENAGKPLRDLVAGHSACIRAFLLRATGRVSEEPERLIALSREAQRLLPQEEKGIRATAALNLGYGNQALVDLEAASLAFKQALEDGVAGGNYYAAIYGPINLVFAAILAGDLGEALRLCEMYIERFSKIMAGRYFAPLGALCIFKGGILLEQDYLGAAEQALTEGLDLIRWTGEAVAPKRGYTGLARLRGIQGNLADMLSAVSALQETWPEGDLYVQSLRHRLSLRQMPSNPSVQRQAYAWLAGSGIDFRKLGAIQSVDPVSITSFESYLNAAHVLARLAKDRPGTLPVEGALDYLLRQEDFARKHGFKNWVVKLELARALLYQASGKKEEALDALEQSLNAAAGTGFFRIFLDECEPVGPLLEELRSRLRNEPVASYANRILDALGGGGPKPQASKQAEALLSERELQVLNNLAGGMSYEQIGRQLFLSLNTVQFHVKNIYRKLLVNKRVQAIERARELRLI